MIVSSLERGTERDDTGEGAVPSWGNVLQYFDLPGSLGESSSKLAMNPLESEGWLSGVMVWD